MKRFFVDTLVRVCVCVWVWQGTVEYLMELADCFGRATGAGVPMFSPTGTVPSTALHQDASWEKHSIGGFQFLPQVYGEITWRAAVQPHVLMETIQINCRSDRDRGHGANWCDCVFGFAVAIRSYNQRSQRKHINWNATSPYTHTHTLHNWIGIYASKCLCMWVGCKWREEDTQLRDLIKNPVNS